jgi:hypothetical protein
MTPSETYALWSAIANCIIASITVVLFGVTLVSLRKDRRRMTKIEEAERRRFAENVYAWVEERSQTHLKIACRNGSNSAVYDVAVSLMDAGGNHVGSPYQIELMKPNEEREFAVETRDGLGVKGVSISFRDPSGVQWVRLATGQLEEVGTVSLHRRALTTGRGRP